MADAKAATLVQQAGVDPIEAALMQAAASGDRGALATLAFIARWPGSYNPPIPLGEALAGAEAFARLAAVHGEPEDMLALADIIGSRANVAADPNFAKRLRFEAIDWCRSAMERGHPAASANLAGFLAMMADSGDEQSAVDLNKLMDDLAPSEAERVQRLLEQRRRQLRAAATGGN